MQIYNGETTKFLKSFKAEVLIPYELMPEVGNYYARAYGTNSHVIDYHESDNKNPGFHTFWFNLDKNDLKFGNYNDFIEAQAEAAIRYVGCKYPYEPVVPGEISLRSGHEIINKEFGALKKAEDSIELDTSYMTIDEVVDFILKKAQELM